MNKRDNSNANDSRPAPCSLDWMTAKRQSLIDRRSAVIERPSKEWLDLRDLTKMIWAYSLVIEHAEDDFKANTPVQLLQSSERCVSNQPTNNL